MVSFFFMGKYIHTVNKTTTEVIFFSTVLQAGVQMSLCLTDVKLHRCVTWVRVKVGFEDGCGTTHESFLKMSGLGIKWERQGATFFHLSPPLFNTLFICNIFVSPNEMDLYSHCTLPRG